MNKYDEVQRISKEEAAKAFASGDPERVCRALVSIAFYDDDWRWVQETCMSCLTDSNPQISGTAATCLGHVARIHRQIDKEEILVALRAHLQDSKISGRVSDAIDDIDMFVQ